MSSVGVRAFIGSWLAARLVHTERYPCFSECRKQLSEAQLSTAGCMSKQRESGSCWWEAWSALVFALGGL